MNSTSSANAVQVAGTHYKTPIQHWDFVVMRKHNYLESQVSKYVTRWFKKDGLKDLRKALHFVQKLQELAPMFAREDQWWRNVLRWAKAHTKAPLPVPILLGVVSVEEYVVANGLDVNGPEHQVIEAIDDWVRGGRTNPERLRDADFVLSMLIGRLEDGVAQKAAQSTPTEAPAPAPAPAIEGATLQQSAQQLPESGAEPGAGYVNQDRETTYNSEHKVYIPARGGDFVGGGASGSWDVDRWANSQVGTPSGSESSSSSDSGSSDSGGSSGD